MKLTGSVFLAAVASIAHGAIVTTTLSPAEQTSAAVVAQQGILEAVIEGVFLTTTMLDFLDGNYPPSLLSLMGDVYNYEGSDFPTSLFVNQLPFSEFVEIFNEAPWKDQILSANGATTLYDPSHYSVVTVTNDDPESTTATPTPSKTSTTIPETTSKTSPSSEPTSEPTSETTSSAPETIPTSTSATTTSPTYSETSQASSATSTAEPTTLETSSTSSAEPTLTTSEFPANAAAELAVPGVIALFALVLI